MKASLNWLRELLPESAAALDGATAAEILTRVGLEVEGVEEKGRDLSGVLVAEVLGIRPHPGADKLRLVRVRAGGREEEVVCGAPNVPPPGNRVAWAAPGARLPGGRTLEAREVRGVMSPGMLCSEPELGLGDKGDGILILSPWDESGADLVAAHGLRDDVLEVNVTPNRPDALSHLGLARELAAALGVAVRLPGTEPPRRADAAAAESARRDVQIAGGAGCPRYQARFVTGLTVAASPLAVRLRLAHCGVRPISNLVDVTNWVLLELGHPLHAFDQGSLSGPIQVRRARPGEKLVTLDGVERGLEAGDVVIADERGAVALAGVMGGARTEVKATTTQVLLEAATFDPVSVRRTSKRLGLVSEASYRFERGVDAEGVPLAAARAVALLAQLGGGAVLDLVVDRYPQPVAPRSARLPLARLQRLAGAPIPLEEATRQLAKVSTRVTVEEDDGKHDGKDDGKQDGRSGPVLRVEVPSYRPDLQLPEDLVEEVLRLSGRYEAPAQIERVLANARSLPNPERMADRTRDLLAAVGLSEVVTWGFVPRARLQALGGALADGVTVRNPISADYEVMRTSLLPGLAEALRHNLSRGLAQAGSVRLFEVGPVVVKGPPGQPPVQREQAALVLAGLGAGWLKPGEPLDFFDLKRVVQAVLAGLGADLDAAAGVVFSASDRLPFLHPGVAADVRVGEGAATLVGGAGELHPALARQFGLEARTFYAELDLAALAEVRAPLRAVTPPRFPAVGRDLSFWLDEAVPASTQRAAFLAAGEPLLRELAVREDFRDPRYAPAGKKGMLWSMTYRADDRTLTDAEVDAAHARVVAAASGTLTITIR